MARQNGKAFGAMKGRLMRTTTLDSCGRIVYGDQSQAVSKGFISAEWTANTITTEEVNQPNAAGERCVYQEAETEFVSYSVVLTFCEVDPEMFSQVTGQRVITDSEGEPVGFAINSKVSLNDRAIALEIWAGAPAADSCDDPNAQGNFGYFLAPYLKGGILGDYSIVNGAINFTITGMTTRDGNRWGVGPYDVTLAGGVPAPLVEPLDRFDHKLMIWVPLAPPKPFYGLRPVLERDKTPLTAVVAVEGTSPTEAKITFTGGAAGVPVYVEFGDGTWDYLASGTPGTDHIYDENGTYTITATTNGKKVSTTVTIPFP